MKRTRKVSKDNVHLIPQEALGRSLLYKLLAQALARPDKSLWEGLVSADFAAKLDEATVALPYSLGLVAEGLAETIKSGLDGISYDDLEIEYTRLLSFESANGCFFYETEYTASHEFMKTQQLADVAGFYRAFGLVVSENQQQRPDYIATELEFMHFLIFKEARASYQGEELKKELCLDAQRKFLKDHLGRWLPIFRQTIENSANVDFYKGLAKLVETFVAQDAAYLGVSPKPLLKPPAIPRYSQEQDGCPLVDRANCPVTLQLSGGNGFNESR